MKRRASPRPGVHTIGNGVDGHSGEHLARSFSVLLGDAVHVRTQAQRKLRHVHGSALSRGFLQAGDVLLRLQNSLHQVRSGGVTQVEKVHLLGKHARQVFHRKPVMSGRNGRMRGENAFAADVLNILAADRSAPRLLRLLTQQF